MNSSICFLISAACPAAGLFPRSGPRSIASRSLVFKMQHVLSHQNQNGETRGGTRELESRKLQPCAPTHLVSRSYRAGRRASACRIKVLHEARLMLRVSTNETARQW